jgi:uncharacterized membrane protein
VSGRWSTGRVEAFSDGVFAIAITLLVLEIRIEPEAYDHLWRALADEWPAYLAYVTSFLTVGSVWIAHHSLYSRLRYVDPFLLRLNMLLLLVAAFLPFPTAVLAQAFGESDSAERAAVVLYGATALTIEWLLAAAGRYAATHPELGETGGEGPAPLTRVASSSALYSLAAIIGILLLPKLAAIGYLIVAIRGVFFGQIAGRFSLRWLRS